MNRLTAIALNSLAIVVNSLDTMNLGGKKLRRLKKTHLLLLGFQPMITLNLNFYQESGYECETFE